MGLPALRETNQHEGISASLASIHDFSHPAKAPGCPRSHDLTVSGVMGYVVTTTPLVLIGWDTNPVAAS